MSKPIQADNKIYANLKELCCGTINPSTISALTDEEIKSIRTSNAKVNYIRSITEAVTTGKLVFEDLKSLTDDEVSKLLMSVCGIGK